MRGRLESHMIEPIRMLMLEGMGLEVIAEEFSSGYGIADLVGARISHKNCQSRQDLGIALPIDHKHLLEVLLLLRPGIRRSCEYLAKNVSFSESRLCRTVLPQLRTHGFIECDKDKYVRLLVDPPVPTEHIVAVEAKQSRWKTAILQARRYSFFADQSYIAVWSEIAPAVDREMLYRHRLGLISVEDHLARVLSTAPVRRPREPKMSRYCAESLYQQIQAQSISRG